MKLLLANESDCRFFKFWFGDRVCDGISYQGEMFYQFHQFRAQRRDQAYELGSRLLERGVSVIICCSREQYIVGVNLRGEWQQISTIDKQQFLAEVLDLESAMKQLLD